MKKLFNLSFIMILFLLFCGSGNAARLNNTTILWDENKLENVYTNDDILSVDLSTGSVPMYVAYYDKNDTLLEAFMLKEGYIFGYNKSQVKVGYNCLQAYGTAFDNPNEMCNSTMYSLYSSNNDFSNIKYWFLYSYGGNTSYSNSTSNDIYTLYNWCQDNAVAHNSNICSNVLFTTATPTYGQYYSMITLKEYVPAKFKLICDPKEVKKGETSSCDLVINAEDEINEITVPMNSDLFDITKFNEVEGWELVDNKDGTITITSESGFKGEGVVLGATLKFKEELTDDVEIILDDINYTTSEGYELSTTAQDSVTIYEEPSVEEPKSEEEVKENPNTSDNVSLVSVVFLLTIYTVLIIYSVKKDLR